MYTLPNTKQYQDLKEFRGDLCISFYMTCQDIESTARAVHIKLKNHVKSIEKLLLDSGVEPADVDNWTKHLHEFMNNNDNLSAIRNDAAVFFVHPEQFQWFRIPAEHIEDKIVLQEGFYLDHIDELLDQNQKYFVLLLGHKDVRLLRGDTYSIEPISLGKFKNNMTDALAIDEFPRSIEKHMVAPATQNDSEGTHGQYNAKEVDKELLTQFFRKLDKHIQPLLRKENYPLVLAGVKYLLPIYKKVTTYPNVAKEYIVGNQSHVDPEHIHTKATGILSGAH